MQGASAATTWRDQQLRLLSSLSTRDSPGTSTAAVTVAASSAPCPDCCSPALTIYDCADCTTTATPAGPWSTAAGTSELACCAALSSSSLAFPPPPPVPPYAVSGLAAPTALAECFECAVGDHSAASAGDDAAAAAAAKSHLAWCCDDADCLPLAEAPSGPLQAAPVAPVNASVYHPLVEAAGCCTSVLPTSNAVTTAATTPTEEWMRWSAAALAQATEATAGAPRGRTTSPEPPCSDPSCGVVAISPPESNLADCPSCVNNTVAKTTTATGQLDHDGLPHTDLDELLNGLDEGTIQDILNCCCCDTALHDQPATFDPASHTQHQQLPQHIHCHDAHLPPPTLPLPALGPVSGPIPHGGFQSQGFVSAPAPTSFYRPGPASAPPNSHPYPPSAPRPLQTAPPTPTSAGTQNDLGVSAAAAAPQALADASRPSREVPLRCEWRDCTASSFGTHEALVAHVMTSHLAVDVSATPPAPAIVPDVTRQVLSQLAQSVPALSNGSATTAPANLDAFVRALVGAIGANLSGATTAPFAPAGAGPIAARSGPVTSHKRPRPRPARSRPPPSAGPSSSHVHPHSSAHAHSYGHGHGHGHGHGDGYAGAASPHGVSHPHTHHSRVRHHHHPYGAARAHAAAVEAAKQREKQDEDEAEVNSRPESVCGTAATTTTTTTVSPPSSNESSRKRRRVVATMSGPPSPVSLYELPLAAGGDALAVAEAAAALSQARLLAVGGGGGPVGTTTPRSGTEPDRCLYPCRWRGCPAAFETTALLMEHLSTVHVGAGKARYTCEWQGCERSTGVVCFGEVLHHGDNDAEHRQGEVNGEVARGPQDVAEEDFERRRDARDDKGVFRQRQKVMRHLQMHTGDRPYACQVCGKTFSESLTLTQHMRVHTQEKPYECDYPGCGKAFALASALTIHKRTHTGSRPFTCPFEGCDAAFSESSNLSKHVRVHSAERRYACLEPGCGKAFARSDQLKRHRRVHDRDKVDKGACGGGGRDGNRGRKSFRSEQDVNEDDGDGDWNADGNADGTCTGPEVGLSD